MAVRFALSRVSHVQAPEYRSIVAIDMVGSGQWDDCAQLRARTVLDAMVRSAFRAAGISWRKLVVEDRGDGMVVLVPPSTSKVDLIDPLIPSLIARLRQHNAMVGAEHRIRVRVAVHAGEVLRSPSGWVGTDINLTCRLLNGVPLYRELMRSPQSDLVLVVSEVIRNGVVRHGYRRIDPAEYRCVHIVSKEVDTSAWIYVAGVDVGPAT